jgi:hypothetical protein
MTYYSVVTNTKGSLILFLVNLRGFIGFLFVIFLIYDYCDMLGVRCIDCMTFINRGQAYDYDGFRLHPLIHMVQAWA